MRGAAKILMGAGIVVLAMWAWFGYRGQVVMAKKIEPKSVKVRFLVEGGKGQVEAGPVTEVPTVSRSDKEWANRLTIEQFRIGRTHGTERAFCGVFHDNKKNGVYVCAGCGLPLFKSDDKFDSGTGWPSFFMLS